MLNPLNPVLNTIIVYILTIILLLYNKPSIIYDKKTKKYKQFGTTKGKSILSLPILIILIAIFTYIIFFYIENSTIIQMKYESIITCNK